MKIGLAQINSTVGDFPANAKRIVSAYREALDQGAEIVLAPEMALVRAPAWQTVSSKKSLKRAGKQSRIMVR